MQTAIRHMDLLTEESLKALLEDREGPCVSIYLPTYRRGPETQQNPIRLKNLVRMAEEKLLAAGMRSGSDELRDLLAPAVSRIDDPGFWRFQCDGLALFLSSSGSFSFRLPLGFDELVHSGERFHIRPLIPMLNGDGRFYVLALNEGGVRLLQGSRFSVGEIELKDTPTSLREVLANYDFEDNLQPHSVGGPSLRGGPPGAAWHGQSGPDDADVKRRIREFFLQLDQAIRGMLGDERAPLILAGVDFLQGIYREVNHYKPLIEKGIAENPGPLSPEQIHERAWAIAEPLFQRDRLAALARFDQLAGNQDERALTDLEKIIKGAYFRMIDTLFIQNRMEQWGRFHPDSLQVDQHERPEPADEELLDFAVFHTLRNSGTVYCLDFEMMPRSLPAAAIQRFPASGGI